jgi:hypothetical protein
VTLVWLCLSILRTITVADKTNGITVILSSCQCFLLSEPVPDICPDFLHLCQHNNNNNNNNNNNYTQYVKEDKYSYIFTEQYFGNL